MSPIELGNAEIIFIDDPYPITQPSHVFYVAGPDTNSIVLNKYIPNSSSFKPIISWSLESIKDNAKDIVKVSIIMTALFVENDKDINLVSSAFLNIKEEIYRIDPFSSYNDQQFDFIYRKSRELLSDKYMILFNCSYYWEYHLDIQHELRDYRFNNSGTLRYVINTYDRD